jgi:hypothetical protein
VPFYQIKKMFASLKSPLAAPSPDFPDHPLGAKTEAANGGVVVESLFAKATFATGADLGAVFRHRYLLAHYLGFSGPVFAAFLMIGPGTHRDSEHMPSVMIGLIAMLYAVGLYVRVLRWLSRGRAEPVHIPLTLGLLIGVAALMAVGLSYTMALGLVGLWSPLRLCLLFAVLSLYAEVTVAVILRKAVPRAIIELQARAARERVLSLSVAPAVAQDVGVPEPAVPAAVPAVLEGVLRVEAQGNHVLVVTEKGRHLLPGPFGAFVVRLPTDLGRQVHRSHWVACRAIIRTRRQGRDVIIETVDGAQVPVASTKFGALRTWLLAATGRTKSDETIHKDGGMRVSR